MLRRYTMVFSTAALAVLLAAWVGLTAGLSQQQTACEALTDIRNLAITSAELRKVDESRALRLGYDVVQYCYVKGIIAPAIRFHVQLPLPEHWNGRFLSAHRADASGGGGRSGRQPMTLGSGGL